MSSNPSSMVDPLIETSALLTLDCMLFLDSVEVSDGSMEDFKRLNAELLAPEWELQ